VDRGWLEEQLAAGRSIESIAREVDRDPSTVSYWVHKHGLVSSYAERHAARGGIERERLEELVAQGLTTREIAAQLDRSQATVRHWLREYGLRVRRAREPKVQDVREVQRWCATHGVTTFVRYGPDDHLRCRLCRRQRVSDRRRRVKEILVAEAGGACRLCGYDRSVAALHFHHIDPEQKLFGLALRGVARSLERCRAEARKCVLLCANCHAEVEAGLARLPLATDGAATAPGPG
jgi:Homeodomain-like domain-containing protein